MIHLDEAADSRAHVHAYAEAVLLTKVQARVGDCHSRCGDRQLGETRHALRCLAVHVLLGVEAVHLAGELGRQLFGRIAALDHPRRAAALDEAVPVLIKVLAERIHGPHSGHDDPRPTICLHWPTSARILPTS